MANEYGRYAAKAQFPEGRVAMVCRPCRAIKLGVARTAEETKCDVCHKFTRITMVFNAPPGTRDLAHATDG